MKNELRLKTKQVLTLFLTFITIYLQGQQLAPAVTQNISTNTVTTPSVPSLVSSTCSNGCDRQAIINDYNTNYIGSAFNLNEMAWTGDATTCDPGNINSIIHQKMLQRINYFRRLVCVSDDIYFDAVKNSKCQESALMQEANGELSHCSGPNNAPCDTWLCNTTNAIQAAQNSNIATNFWNSANPIDMYIKDSGSNNVAVGHRRWILFSRGNEMGNGITSSNQVLWVLGNYAPTPTYNNFIAYPSPGFFPRSLIYNRWSFGIPGADFSSATVSVKKDGVVIPTNIISSTANYGDPTLVWSVPGTSFSSDEDVEFEVTVSGVTGASASSYTYKVIAIKEVMPSISFEQTDPFCENNGLATANYSAGANSYHWLPGGDTTQTITDLYAGTYTVEVTDIHGCSFIDSVIVVTDTVNTPQPGNGTPTNLQYIEGNDNLIVSTTNTQLKTDEAIGWWITKSAPIHLSITDQITLDSALANSTVQPYNNSSAIGFEPSVLFLNDSVTTGIAYDCNNMDTQSTYYATPFITSYRTAIPDTSCHGQNGLVGNIFVGGRPGKFTSIAPEVITCRPESLLGMPIYTLEVTVSDYSGVAGDLALWVLDNGFTGGTIAYLPFLAGNGSYTFSQNDFSNYTPSDPGDPIWTTGLTVLAWQLSGNGMQAGNIELSLNITYPGDPGIPFPNMTYSECIFGDPVPFTCSTCATPSNIPTTGGQYHATDECTDDFGWTHYWDNVDGISGNSDDLLLLSIQKGENNIGTIDDGTFDLFIDVGNQDTSSAIHIPQTVPYVTNPEGWYVMDRYWFVSPTTQPSTAVSVRFYYSSMDYNAISNALDISPLGHESLTFYKTINPANPDPGTGHVDITSAQIIFYNEEGIDWLYTGDGMQDYHTAELSFVSEFSGGGGGASNCEGCGPLPIELISFTGQKNDNHILLTWETASEENNDYFILEKSINGIHFAPLSRISGGGTSEHKQQYTYKDENPNQGNNYYRLLQNDYDGSRHYAGDIIVINYQSEQFISVYPNPTSSTINIRSNQSMVGNVNYKLYDALGRTIQQGVLNHSDLDDHFLLDISHFHKGLYLFKFSNNGKENIVTFLKE